MRILLAHNSLYYPSHGGGDKSNRLLLEALAARGHACRAIARTAGFGPQAHRELLDDLQRRAVVIESSAAGIIAFRHNSVEVHVVTANANLRAYFAAQIAVFAPQVILASTDDPAQVLLEAALRAEDARVVYLARATLAVPFGPDSAFPSRSKTETLRHVDRIVGVSEYVAGYVRQWSGIDATHVPVSLMESEPCPTLGRFENEFVTLVNPCAVKGISIFLALADGMPETAFAAVPTWGTNSQDHTALAARGNVTMLAPVDRIDDLLARTRVLLVPSLWAEARSRIIVEAMLRGVPVIASNMGGIPEAKMGVDYTLPVRPIERYQPQLDEQMVPIAEVPPQDIGPWAAALGRLLNDRAHYEEISLASRAAALVYLERLTIHPFEALLEAVARSPRHSPATLQREEQDTAAEKLSPGRRKLLAMRMRKLSAAAAPQQERWFPNAAAATFPAPSKVRLFCFPHAGGGASAFHRWAGVLSPEIAVCAARLPGRESRAREAPLTSMSTLVDAAAQALQPYLAQPFAFFGHSMGAAIAFELARQLRRSGQPLPVALIVSGARAPQFRSRYTPAPEPSEEQFVEELHRLGGIPKSVLDHPELMKLILPVLRSDAALYRNYIYAEEPPLTCPIHAYGGAEDPNVQEKHLQAWSLQTTASFSLRRLPGGHFFLETAQDLFLRFLAQDLNAQ